MYKKYDQNLLTNIIYYINDDYLLCFNSPFYIHIKIIISNNYDLHY